MFVHFPLSDDWWLNIARVAVAEVAETLRLSNVTVGPVPDGLTVWGVEVTETDRTVSTLRPLWRHVIPADVPLRLVGDWGTLTVWPGQPGGIVPHDGGIPPC